MKPQEIVSETIATVRASKNVELRMAANEHPEKTMSLEETASVVDQALQETLLGMMDALDLAEQDERSERDSWWQGYPEGHPYDTRWGKGDKDYPLPRVSSTSFWWNQ